MHSRVSQVAWQSFYIFYGDDACHVISPGKHHPVQTNQYTMRQSFSSITLGRRHHAILKQYCSIR